MFKGEKHEVRTNVNKLDISTGYDDGRNLKQELGNHSGHSSCPVAQLMKT